MKAVTTFNRRGRDGEEGGCLEDEQSFEGHSEEMRPESLATVIVEHLALLTGRIQRPIDIERRTSDKPLNLKWLNLETFASFCRLLFYITSGKYQNIGKIIICMYIHYMYVYRTVPTLFPI